jgi:hypothetical protein
MEVLEELHRPCRVDVRVADPNCLAYQSHKLAEVGFSKPANVYAVGVTHVPREPLHQRILHHPGEMQVFHLRPANDLMASGFGDDAQLGLRPARAAFTSSQDRKRAAPCEPRGHAKLVDPHRLTLQAGAVSFATSKWYTRAVLPAAILACSSSGTPSRMFARILRDWGKVDSLCG